MSKKRRHKSERSPKEWTIRLGAAGLALVVGFYSVSDTLANVVVKADPVRAHALAPWDGKITGKLAEYELQMAFASESDNDPVELARLALRQDATAVELLTVLALDAQSKNQPEKVRALFSHSRALSRRELQTHIWAIEEAVSRGDIKGALRQYDMALRTSRRAPDMLFPILTAALGQPKVRSELVDLLKEKPVWSDAFITFAGNRSDTPGSTAQFFQQLEKSGAEVDSSSKSAIVNSMAGKGDTVAAWRYYASFRKGADASRSRDGNFAASLERPSAFDWQALSTTGVFATLQPGADGGSVEFSASPGSGGRVLQQRQLLAPGTYRLDAVMADVDGASQFKPYWTLICDQGGELGRVEISNATGDAKVSGTFTVPSGCNSQTMALVVRPSDDISGVFGRVKKAALVPASAVKEGS